jgi:hypothetical protein
MITERSPYLSTIAKKSPWQAVAVDRGPVLEGAEETLLESSCIAPFGDSREGTAG